MATIPLRKSVVTTTATTATTILHRALSTVTTHHKDHARNHVYLPPTTFIGSFSQPETPKEAWAKLARLRHDYRKQVKVLRRQYIDEMEVERLEKVRKLEARKVEMIEQQKVRRKEKAVRAQAVALQRHTFDQDLRLTLMKEKTEKLEYWQLRQEKIANKKNSKQELICKQSSKWIDEKELEAKVLQAIVDSKVL